MRKPQQEREMKSAKNISILLAAIVVSTAAATTIADAECLRLKVTGSAIARPIPGAYKQDPTRERRARFSAIADWQKKARVQAGAAYANFKKSQGKRISCAPTLRMVNSPVQCTVSATPCR
jgi:hypothetical protein